MTTDFRKYIISTSLLPKAIQPARHLWRGWVVALILLFFTPLFVSASPIPDEEASYVLVVPQGQGMDEVSDSVFYALSRTVVFPVNKYVITDSVREQLRRELTPYFQNDNYRLDQVILRGAASPEGPYKWNETLSKYRSNALLREIERMGGNGIMDRLRMSRVAEDYIYVLLMMKEHGDADAPRVEALVNQWLEKSPWRLKVELQKLDKGQLWRRLLKDYFPQMRAARLLMVFSRLRPEEIEIPPVPIEEPPVVLPPPTVIQPLPVELPSSPDPIRLQRREVLSVKTNLLMDLAYMPFGYDRFCPLPNVAIEYYPLHGHFTFGASFDCPWWQDYDAHKYMQIRNYQVEARYYFKSGDVNLRTYGNGPAFRHWYVQAYAHAALYGVCFDDLHGYEGEGWGAGLGVGYVLPLGRNSRWRLEFGVQAGFFRTKYDPYQWLCPVDPDKDSELYYYKWYGDAADFKRRQHRFSWLGPTRVGITLTYDLLFRRRLKKGVSFNRSEAYVP